MPPRNGTASVRRPAGPKTMKRPKPKPKAESKRDEISDEEVAELRKQLVKARIIKASAIDKLSRNDVIKLYIYYSA